MSIPGHHLRWFSETVRQIYVARTLAELNRALLPAMHRHLDLTIALCESATLDFTQTSLEAAVSHYAPPKDFQLHMGDCPSLLRAMAGDRSPQLHFWDAGRAMESTHFYNFLCRPFGVRDQVINAVWGPERLTVFSASRDRLFTSGEQAVLALLHPHLTAGLLRVDGARPAAAAPFGHPWVAVDSKGKPIGLTAEQDALLRAYFPAAKSYRHDWPEPIARWLAAVRVALATMPLIDPPPALQAESTRGRLGFRYLPDPAGTGGSVRLIENPAATKIGRAHV